MTWVFLALCVGLLVYEGVAVYTKRDGDTISEIVWYLSARPLVPFLFGLLMGHFFWPRGGP